MGRAERLLRQLCPCWASLGAADVPDTRLFSTSAPRVDKRGLNNTRTEHMSGQRQMPNYFTVSITIFPHGVSGNPPGVTPYWIFSFSTSFSVGSSTLPTLGLLRTFGQYSFFAALMEGSLSLFGGRMSFLIKFESSLGKQVDFGGKMGTCPAKYSS